MRNLAACTAVFLLLACSGEPEQESAPAGEMAAGESAVLPATFEAAKAANEKYTDVNVALAEGYIEDPAGKCVEATEMGLPAETGAMGIHYIDLAALGTTLPAGPPPAGFRVSGTDATIDPMRPEVLVYEPTADGGRTLVAIEYLVFEQAWRDAGNTTPPVIDGQQFFHMADDPATPLDEAHGFEPHYELHVWTHRSNPAGLFAEWNTTVHCPPGGAAHTASSH